MMRASVSVSFFSKLSEASSMSLATMMRLPISVLMLIVMGCFSIFSVFNVALSKSFVFLRCK